MARVEGPARYRVVWRTLVLVLLALYLNTGRYRGVTQADPTDRLGDPKITQEARFRYSTRSDPLGSLRAWRDRTRETSLSSRNGNQPGLVRFGANIIPAALRTSTLRTSALRTSALTRAELDGALSPGTNGRSEVQRREPGEAVAETAEARKEDLEELARPSAFERQLETYVDPERDGPITQFGYDVFRRERPALLDVPVGDSYVLGVGDELVISLWGNEEIDVDLPALVRSDGQIRIPDVGVLAVKGLSLSEAQDLVRRRFDRLYKGYQLQLRLGKIRDIAVHVTGRAHRPGRQRVSSVSTLFDALSAAGGISKDGTLRRIVLRRAGQEDRQIDLYNYLIGGDVAVDLSLSPNDSIVVGAVGPRVAILGSVLRPAIYEIGPQSPRTSLARLLEMAGGFDRLADIRGIQIESSHPGNGGRTLASHDLTRTEAEAIELEGGDVVIVRDAIPRVDNVVYLDGDVSQPGRYAHREGMRVSDLITSDRLVESGFWAERLAPDGSTAEAELPEPYLDYALIRRIHPRSGQERRLAFHLGRAILERDPSEDLVLHAQDTVVIFPKDEFDPPRAVFVSGTVNQPGKLEHFDGMRVRDLIRMSGGLRPESLLTGAILTRIHPEQDGARSEQLELDVRRIMAGEEDANLLLIPEDHLAIKRVPLYRLPIRVTVEGEVPHPGEFSMVQGQRLSDLLARVGGPTDDAYLPAVQLYRESVRKIQQQRMEESLRRLELEAKLTSQSYVAEAEAVKRTNIGEKESGLREEQGRVEQLIRTIREMKPQGRMVIRLRSLEELRGSDDDIELNDGDRLIIPRKPEEVHVIGAVQNQTALLHRDGLTVQDYLDSCGGPLETAEPEMIFVIRADGSADSNRSVDRGIRWNSSKWRFDTGGLMNSEIHPGDTVVVPFDVKPKLSQLGVTATVTQIIFQAAIAAGVVVALL